MRVLSKDVVHNSQRSHNYVSKENLKIEKNRMVRGGLVGIGGRIG